MQVLKLFPLQTLLLLADEMSYSSGQKFSPWLIRLFCLRDVSCQREEREDVCSAQLNFPFGWKQAWTEKSDRMSCRFEMREVYIGIEQLLVSCRTQDGRSRSVRSFFGKAPTEKARVWRIEKLFLRANKLPLSVKHSPSLLHPKRVWKHSNSLEWRSHKPPKLQHSPYPHILEPKYGAKAQCVEHNDSLNATKEDQKLHRLSLSLSWANSTGTPMV